MRFPSWAFGVALTALGALSCGAQVVFEDDDDDGSTPQSPASTGPGTPTGPVEEACRRACQAIEPCLEAPDTCLPGCVAAGSACYKPWVDFLECVAESYVASCRTTAVCSAELAAYQLCGGVCPSFDPKCTGDATSCDCRQTGCGGIDAPELRYQCTQEETAIACDCFVDDQPVGSCKSYGGECSGPIGSSCCGALVYTPRP